MSLIIRIADWLEMRARRAAARRAHALAFSICRMGFDWEEDIQNHLSAAKDSLYRAATAFDKSADGMEQQ